MVNLFVFTENQYWNLRFRNKKEWNDFQFNVVRKEVEIHYKQKKYRIHDGNTLKIEQFRFLLDGNICGFHIYKRNRLMSFGRNRDNTYSLDHLFISGYQFKIVDDKLIDLNSTNGTYLNGTRIHNSILQETDQIAFANVIVYVFQEFILMNQVFDDELLEIESQCHLVKLQKHKSSIQMKQDIETIELETPLFQEEVKKGKWFESIGSSLLLLVSSCISMGIRYVLNPTETSQLETMLLTSGSMCFAFLIYGIWNRNNTWKESLEQKKRKDSLYIEYLKEQSEKIEYKKNEFRKRDIHFERQCIQFSPEMYGIKHDIWLCKTQQRIFEITSKTIPYQNSKYPLSLELKKMIQKENQLEFTNYFMDDSEKIWIQSDSIESVLYLYLQSLWTKEDVLWVWLTKRRLSHVLECSHSKIKHQFLWIKDETDVLEIQSLIAQKEFYLVSDTDLFLKVKLGYKKLIYISKTPISISFDSIISKYPVINHSINVLRQILYQLNWQQQFSFSKILQVDSIYEYSISWSKKLNLKIPIGIDDFENPIYLDFHDTKDGPHGLVAGTTGSGKSEWLSSVLLQLSLYNDPDLVQYILIDFKGGAFGDSFYQFPHCAGMITNLDENTMDRFMIGLNAEVKERQESFRRSKCSVAHIDTYNQISKQPMSHLFIVIDEFAQLKMKHSDSMTYLKELARIGRSLGIHLILSTQKPLGIIDEQIWSNSRWKVCLKVNDKNDSREVLRNDSASHLKNAGEFIVQVGNQEKEGKGTGFWMQDGADKNHQLCWEEIDDKNKIIHKNQGNIETIFHVLSSKILKMNRSHHWIILPDIADFQDWKQDGFLIDQPYKKEQSFLNLIHKNTIVLYKDEESISTFIKTCLSLYSNYPLYMFGFKSYENYVDDSFINEYWDVEQGIVFIKMKSDINLVWLKTLINNPNVTCVVLTNYCDSKVHELISIFDIQMCVDYASLDIARYFLDSYTIPKIKKNQVLLKSEMGLDTVQIRKIEHVVLKRNRIKLVEPDYVMKVGISNEGNVVYWNKNRKLMICFVQQSYVTQIDSLCLQWIKKDKQLTIGNCLENDVCIVNCLYESSIFQTKEYIESKYDLDVLWLGLGFEDYAYLMKKKVPMDLNDVGVWMTKGKQIVLEEIYD